MNKLIKLICYSNVLVLALITNYAFAEERATIFVSTNACKAYIANDVKLCGADSDCIGIVDKKEEKCKTKDCLAFNSGDANQCLSRDCKATIVKRARMCNPATETNCKVILAKDSDKCANFSGDKSAERFQREKTAEENARIIHTMHQPGGRYAHVDSIPKGATDAELEAAVIKMGKQMGIIKPGSVVTVGGGRK